MSSSDLDPAHKNRVQTPKDLVETLLGLGTGPEPRILGDLTYESMTESEEIYVWLTLPEVGQLMKWAFGDAVSFYNTDGLVPGYNHLTAAYSGVEESDTLCALVQYLASKLPDPKENPYLPLEADHSLTLHQEIQLQSKFAELINSMRGN